MENAFVIRKKEILSDFKTCPDIQLGNKKLNKKRTEAEVLFKTSAKIIPNRYVWHISYPCYRNSILQKGITANEEDNGLVFVNNQIEDPHLLWPITYDDKSLIYGWDIYGEEEMFSSYDFWRIDSKIAGYKGYKIDPFEPILGVRWGWQDVARESHYLCRKEPIPKNALKLFKYRPKSFSRYKKFIPGYKGVKISLIYKCYEGVISVGGLDESRPYYLEEVNLKLLNMVV